MPTAFRVAGVAAIVAATLCFSVRARMAPQSAPEQSSREGLALLHKMQNALGGAEKIAAINDFEETVRAQIWNNSGVPMGEVTKRTRWMRHPNLLRLDQYGPRDTYVLYYDGGAGGGWEMLPDLKNADPFRTEGRAIALEGGELKFAQNYISNFQFNDWLADRMPGYVVTSPAANVIRIARNGSAVDLTLNPATWLPAKSASVSLADPNRPVPAEMHLDEWTEVDGVRFPTRQANYHSGVKLAEETEQGPMRINAGLKAEDLAAKPADFMPVIPGR